MEPRSGGWRLRSRHPHFKVCYATGITDLAKAKKAAREWLDAGGHLKKEEAADTGAAVTLADVVAIYKVIPAKATPETRVQYEYCLRNVVRKAYGKELEQFALRDLTGDLWGDFMLAEQGGKVLDLTTRRVVNDSINSQVRGARSIFIESLWPHYKKRGITFPDGLLTVQWLPHLHRPKPEADDAAMIEAWRALKELDLPMWRAIGLARFAGLRREELNSVRRSWLVVDRGTVKIDIRDREEENYWHKVGLPYKALVINEELAADLLAAPEGLLIQPAPRVHPINKRTMSRDRWFERHLQEWVKPFTGKATKPLHRLRGLYADEVASLTQQAVLARQEGIKEAAANLGHTSTKTTKRHYLSEG